jgi:hypothetical protein
MYGSDYSWTRTSWRWVISFTLRPLYLQGRCPSTHWTERYVGPRTSLHDVEKRKILLLEGLERRTLGRLARSQSLYRLRYTTSLKNYGYLQKCVVAFEYKYSPVVQLFFINTDKLFDSQNKFIIAYMINKVIFSTCMQWCHNTVLSSHLD